MNSLRVIASALFPQKFLVALVFLILISTIRNSSIDRSRRALARTREMQKTHTCDSCFLHFLVFSNARRVLSQSNTRLRLLHLLEELSQDFYIDRATRVTHRNRERILQRFSTNLLVDQTLSKPKKKRLPVC